MIASSYPQNPRWLVAESRPATFLKLQVYKVSQVGSWVIWDERMLAGEEVADANH
jgi:hypothetical protein